MAGAATCSRSRFAIQMLLWGAAQPFVGAIADRFGRCRVLCGGAVLYAVGLAWMAQATTPAPLLPVGRRPDRVRARGLRRSTSSSARSASSLPANWRSLAFGAGTAAGSFGQFLFSPLASR